MGVAGARQGAPLVSADESANGPAEIPKRKRRLTGLQRLFVDEYLVDMNATQAYIRAGGSPSSAKQCGHSMLRKPLVSAAIDAAIDERLRDTRVSAQRVVLELAKLAFANMADYMRVGLDGDPVTDFSNIDRDQAAALSEITVDDFIEGRGEDARAVRRVKFKLHDKRGALVDLGRHLGLFPERHQITGADGGPIEVASASPLDFAAIRAKREAQTG